MRKKKVTPKQVNTDNTTDSTTKNTQPTRHRLKCKNHKQKDFSKLITEKEIIFAIGPAGVGKSYVAIARAIELIQNVSNQYSKMVIINPAVEAEEKYGFMPGDLRDKLDPFVGPSLDIVDKIMGIKNRLKLEEDGIISVGALGFIRGKSIDNTILVMEEAQNMSPHQMKTLLTRIGYNSKFIISGDLDQSDRYKNYKDSGLYDGIQKHKNIDKIGYIEFNESEIVRNPLIAQILNNYKPSNLNGRDYSNVDFNKVIERVNIATTIKKNKKKKPKFIRKFIIWFRKNFRW
jgi:phosphate starvation-inducible PhoH-like protein